MSRFERGVHWGFLESAERDPERVALVVDGLAISYGALEARARSIAAALDRTVPVDAPAYTAIYAHRSVGAYAGVLGALFRGTAYVPIAPEFPASRAAHVLRRTRTRALVVDGSVHARLPELLAELGPCAVVSPDVDFSDELRAALASHRLVGPAELEEAARPADVVSPEALFNVLFTSGSTGVPKGVMVTHGNVAAFLDAVQDRYAFGPDDRFSQFFELVFDLHGFDLHAAWAVGATVVCPTRSDMLFPARYATEHRLSVWFSVPSTAVLMQRMRQLEPGTLPDLRVALFCGEALMVETAAAMQAAAPNAVVENLYGPTEVTLACTWHRFDGAPTPDGLVPIGVPFPGMRAAVVDDGERLVGPGEVGQLCMAGPQVTRGYFEDPEKTGKAFGELPGLEGVFYRTGDLVRRPERDGDPIGYLGRADHQCQVNGYRVELGEVEAAVRAVTGSELAVVIGIPPGAGRADHLVAFVYPGPLSPAKVRKALHDVLPPYMVPKQVRFCEAFPTNTNGKIDRKRLAELAMQGES